MDTLHAQKENVDANAAQGKLRFPGTDKFSTPKGGFVIHEDSKTSGNKGLKDNSSKKSRRVLGDISNKQQNRHGDNNAGGITSTKKTGLGRGLGHYKKLNAKKRTPLTPLRPKSGNALSLKEGRSFTPKANSKMTPERDIKSPSTEEVPDIEHAYGGLPSQKSKSACADEVSREIEELLNSKTPTLFDDIELTPQDTLWDDSKEKAMLEGEELPSPWWDLPDAPTKDETDNFDVEEASKVEDDLSELPPPDNLSGGATGDLGDDGVLDDILSVDIEALCSEQ